MTSDQNNIDLLRNKLTTLDTMCQHYKEEHHNLYHMLKTAEEKDQSAQAFILNEIQSFNLENKWSNG